MIVNPNNEKVPAILNADPRKDEIGNAPRLVLSTASSREEAETLARALVEDGLAACVNLIPGIHSIYRWQGKVEESGECLMLIKTTADRLAELEAALHRLHSYEVPEFLVLPIEGGSDAYLRWLRHATTPH